MTVAAIEKLLELILVALIVLCILLPFLAFSKLYRLAYGDER